MDKNNIYKLKYYKYKNKYLKQKNLLQEGGDLDFTGITAFIGNTIEMHTKYDIENKCLYNDKKKICKNLNTVDIINFIGNNGVIFKNNENKFYEVGGSNNMTQIKNLSKNYEIVNKEGKVQQTVIIDLLKEINNINFLFPMNNSPRKIPVNWILIYDIKKRSTNELLYSNE